LDTAQFVALRHKRSDYSLARLAGCVFIFALFVSNSLINTAVASSTCKPLVIPTMATLADPNAADWYYNLANGQPGVTMTLELYSPQEGTIDLAAGVNQNYSTCSQCVLLRQDAVGETPSKLFFQDQGTLFLSTAPGADPLPVAFQNLRLIEVTINGETVESTPVPNGECYERSGTVFANGFEN
jgi:hypothetical protein